MRCILKMQVMSVLMIPSPYCAVSAVRVSFVHFICNLERRRNFALYLYYLSMRLGFLKQNCRTVEKTLIFELLN